MFPLLGGSLIGGVTTFAAAWITQRRQANVQLFLQEKARRQELYKQFIEEASKLYIDALIHDQVAVQALPDLYCVVQPRAGLSLRRAVAAARVPQRPAVWFGHRSASREYD
jgi:hypothetical protein